MYVDGSCAPGILPERSRAAWSVVQLRELSEEPTAVIHGIVPRWLPQIAQAAEHVAMAVAAMLAQEHVKLVCDCEGVVRRGQEGAKYGDGVGQGFLWRSLAASIADACRKGDSSKHAEGQGAPAGGRCH